MSVTLSLAEKLAIIKMVLNPEVSPKTDGELDVFMAVLKKSDTAKYHLLMSRLSAANKIEAAFNSAVAAFWADLEKSFPDVVEPKTNENVRMRFNSAAKMATYNWIAANVKNKR